MDNQLIEDYEAIFEIFDAENAGSIPNSEIPKMMQALGESPTEDEIEELVRRIDYNEDGACDFNEFVCMMVINLAKEDNKEEELVQVFNRFDQDGDGEISAPDLINIFASLGVEIDEDEALDMIYCLDKDDDGKINFEEFV